MSHSFLTGDDFSFTFTIDQCLSCGGSWLYNKPRLRHESLAGERAVECEGVRPVSCHHYQGECPESLSVHCTLSTDCNCLHCYS